MHRLQSKQMRISVLDLFRVLPCMFAVWLCRIVSKVQQFHVQHQVASYFPDLSKWDRFLGRIDCMLSADVSVSLANQNFFQSPSIFSIVWQMFCIWEFNKLNLIHLDRTIKTKIELKNRTWNGITVDMKINHFSVPVALINAFLFTSRKINPKQCDV